MAPGVIAGKVPGNAATTRPAAERPLQGLLARRGNLCLAATKVTQPVTNDVKIIVLIKRVERDPQTETLGQLDLFLGVLARVNLVTDRAVLQILVHRLRHQVAAI